jgi:hypothetical protein
VASDSGWDVDGDTVLDEPDQDTIYDAEVEAVLRALDRAAVIGARVAVLRFAETPELVHPLSADLASVRAAVEALGAHRPEGETNYALALAALRAEVERAGDLVNRPQHAWFLSDDNPTDSMSGILAEARALADLGVRVHTVDLKPQGMGHLIRIAEITGGVYLSAVPPGAILHLLPMGIGGWVLTVLNETTDAAGWAAADPDTDAFEASVPLGPGANRVLVVLTLLDPGPHSLECAIDLDVEIERPPDPGNHLEIRKTTLLALEAAWEGAPDRLGDQAWRISRAEQGSGPFRSLATSLGKVRTLNVPAGPLAFFDLRLANCVGDQSYDPFPATSDVLPTCWQPAMLASSPPLASNLTDPACDDQYPEHACNPVLDTSGVDRTFLLDVASAGVYRLESSDPLLWIAIYGPSLECVAFMRGAVQIDLPAPGLYPVVVDAAPGGECDFHLQVERP